LFCPSGDANGQKSLYNESKCQTYVNYQELLADKVDVFRLPLTDLFIVKIDWSSRDLSGASPPSRRDDLSEHIS
jgi:hypothetical protein